MHQHSFLVILSGLSLVLGQDQFCSFNTTLCKGTTNASPPRRHDSPGFRGLFGEHLHREITGLVPENTWRCFKYKIKSCVEGIEETCQLKLYSREPLPVPIPPQQAEIKYLLSPRFNQVLTNPNRSWGSRFFCIYNVSLSCPKSNSVEIYLSNFHNTWPVNSTGCENYIDFYSSKDSTRADLEYCGGTFDKAHLKSTSFLAIMWNSDPRYINRGWFQFLVSCADTPPQGIPMAIQQPSPATHLTISATEKSATATQRPAIDNEDASRVMHYNIIYNTADILVTMLPASSMTDDVFTTKFTLSVKDVYTTMHPASSITDDILTSVSSIIDDIFTPVSSITDDISSITDDIFISVSSITDDVFATMLSTSSRTDDIFTTMLTSSLKDVYTTMLPATSLTDDISTTMLRVSSITDDVFTTMLPVSSITDDVFTTMLPVSSITGNAFTTMLPVSCISDDVFTTMLPVSSMTDDDDAMTLGVIEEASSSFVAVPTPAFIPAIPPKLLTSPMSIRGKIGERVILSCIAVAQPPPQYTWMVFRGEGQMTLENETDSALIFPSLAITDRGVYSCKASNVLDFDSSDEVIVSIEGVAQYIIALDFGDQDEVKVQCSLSKKIDDFLQKNITSDLNLGVIVNVYSLFSSSVCDNLTKSRASKLPTSTLQLRTTLIVANQGSVSSRKLEEFFDSDDEFKKFGFESVAVARFDGCPEESFEIVYFDGNETLGSISITWPESEIGELVTLECPCGSTNIALTLGLSASRVCRGDFVSQAFWEPPNVTACRMLDFILCEISLDPPRKQSEGTNTFIQQEEVGAFDLTAVSLILEGLAGTDEIVEDPLVLDNSLSTIDGILNLTPHTILEGQIAGRSSERIVDVVKTIASMAPIMENTSVAMFQRENFAIVSTDIVGSVESLLIRVKLNTQVRDLNDLRQEPFSVESGNLSTATQTAFLVELNEEVLEFYLQTANSTAGLRLFSVVYEVNSPLFQDMRNQDTGSIIVSVGRAEGPAPANLSDPVMLVFEPTEDLNLENNDSATCVFWDFSENDGTGGWSSDGCVASSIGSTVVCLCDHLTSFTVLLNVNPSLPVLPASLSKFHESLTVTSYVGAIISSLCLILTASTYLLSSKLRSTEHGQLLIQMCLSLVGLYISFLISSLLGNNYNSIVVSLQKPICITFSALMHYFFLVYFFITVSQSVLMYVKIVKVLGGETILSSYHLKVKLVAWVSPLILVGIFLGPAHDYYIQPPPNENGTIATCFPRDWPLYLGVISPFAVIYIFNVVMFIIILTSVLRHGKSSEREGKAKKFFKKFIITFILAVMFGIGWIFGVLGSTGIPRAISYPCQIIFVVIVGFQGLLVFLLHPCRSMEAREEWSKWFYYSTCRSRTYKDRSRKFKVSHAHSKNSFSAATSKPKKHKASVRRKTDRLSSFISSAPRHCPSCSTSSTDVVPPYEKRGCSNNLSFYGNLCPGTSRHRWSDVSVLGATGIAARFGLRRPSGTVSANSQKLGNNLQTQLGYSTSPSILKKIDEVQPPACDCESLNNESQQISKAQFQPYILANNENDLICFSPESKDLFNLKEKCHGKLTACRNGEDKVKPL